MVGLITSRRSGTFYKYSETLISDKMCQNIDSYPHRQALAGGDSSNWYEISDVGNGNNWPLTMTILINEDVNTVTVRFTSSTLDLECVYYDSFQSDSDLVVGWNPDPSLEDTPDAVIIDSITLTRYASVHLNL